jgi:putative spermidine/putrescine transport system substrate-binding protein
VLRGEVPIWINADGNGYKMKHVDGGPVEVVIPAEGTFTMPLVMALVKGAPHREEAKKYLDWLLTAPAQAEFAKSYFRPVLAGALPPDIAAHFLPARDYKRARSLDLAKMAAAADALKKAWTDEIRGSGR